MKVPFKKSLQKWLWPLMPGWPDEGRRIVQGGPLRDLVARAMQETAGFPCVFNAGAGEGGYTPLLLNLPGVQSLVESDFGWRSQAPDRVDPRQRFFCASLTAIPVPKQMFDLTLCTEVLEHIAEHEQALDELARITRPGGWLLITVPRPPAVPDPAHVREGYQPADLRQMLSERGFEVVESRSCMYFFFRLVLKYWSLPPWCPRIVIRTLARLDCLVPLGPPMDLMILGRMVSKNNQLNRVGGSEPHLAEMGLREVSR